MARSPPSKGSGGGSGMGPLGRLTLLAGVQAFALLVFMLGFFLTRQEVPHHSHCQDAALWKETLPPEAVAAAAAEDGDGGEPRAACWAPPRFKRAIIVVIDALRFDFVAPMVEDEDEDGLDPRFMAKGKGKGKGNGPSPEMYYINKLPVVRELLEADPSRALLYRFEADPPTTTMQRLKGLTTGSLPTFLDLRQNFHSPAVAEDSLVRQLRQQGKRLTAMGDDTWQLLFPDAFHRSFPFPSFNTRDLDTVDNGVLQHLLPEMARDDWDVLIAHFLGVDHVGHTFGPSHPAMAAKLGQMDAALRGVVEALEDDTLLLLMGDHGMTDDGNHGGATREETEAALFLYAKGPATPLVQRSSRPHQDDDVLLWVDSNDDTSETGGLAPHRLGKGQAVPRRVAQVDLVPTLALLLGAAVPYANLGGIVPELFFHAPQQQQQQQQQQQNNSTSPLLAPHWRALARRFHANAAQLHRYLLRYAELAHLPPADLARLGALHDAARAAHAQAATAAEGEERVVALLKEACVGYRRFLRGALELGRRVWTQYDVGLMLWALALLAASLLWAAATAWEAAEAEAPPAAAAADPVGGVETRSRRGKGTPAHLPSPTDGGAALRWALAGVGATLLLSWRFPLHFLQQGNDHAAVVIPALLLTLVLAGLALASLPPRIARLAQRWSRAWRQQPKGANGSLPASSIPTAASLALVALHGAGHFSNSYIEAEEAVYLFLGASAAGLLALLHPGSTNDAHQASSVAGFVRRHLPWLVPGLLARLAFEAKGHGQDVGAHFTVAFTLLPLLALLSGYHHYSHIRISQRHGRLGPLALLGAAYLLVLLYWASQADPDAHPFWSTALRLAAPRLVYLGGGLALLFRLLHTDTDHPGRLCLDIAAAISPVLLLVLGPAAPPSLLCQAGSVAALRYLTSNHHHSRHAPASALSTPEIVALGFLGRAFFFATGHHSQFNRLQYSAAFVGFDEFDFVVGGCLLFLNTFGTELLALCLAGCYAASLQGAAEAQRVVSSIGGLSGLSALRTLLTALCVLLQRRHLMVWAIFAPKFIFDAALHVVLSVAGAALLWVLALRGGVRGVAREGPRKLKL